MSLLVPKKPMALTNDGLRQAVPLEAFGDIEDIVPGMRFIAETEMGQRPVQS